MAVVTWVRPCPACPRIRRPWAGRAPHLAASVHILAWDEREDNVTGNTLPSLNLISYSIVTLQILTGAILLTGFDQLDRSSHDVISLIIGSGTVNSHTKN